VQRLEQPLLRRGQADVGAVAAGEAREVDLHLLALDVAGQPADEDDRIGAARGLHRLLERRLRAGQVPGQAHRRVALVLVVLQADVVGPAALELHLDRVRAQALGVLPAVEQQLAIQVEAEAVVGAGLEAIASAHRRQQLATPADAEAVVGHRVVRTGRAPAGWRRQPSVAPASGRSRPPTGGSSWPLQRMLKPSLGTALSGPASPRAIRLSVGEPRSQRKPICASTRTSTGSPARSLLRKYSPRRPRSLVPVPGRRYCGSISGVAAGSSRPSTRSTPRAYTTSTPGAASRMPRSTVTGSAGVP